MVDSIRPLSELGGAGAQREAAPPSAPPSQKLYVRINSTDKKHLRRLELLLEMFPGKDPMVVYFADTGKRLGADCLIHAALLRELREMLGEENVVVK